MTAPVTLPHPPLLVVHEALFGQTLILRAGLTIVGVGPNTDTPARRKQSRHLDILGIHETDEVFHDDVYTVFMKVTVVAKAKQIELQALAFHHSLTGNVADAYLGKVGLARDGAQTGKLGAVEPHPIVVVWVLVFKRFEHLGGIIHTILRLASQGVQALFFSCFVLHRVYLSLILYIFFASFSTRFHAFTTSSSYFRKAIAAELQCKRAYIARIFKLKNQRF